MLLIPTFDCLIKLIYSATTQETYKQPQAQSCLEVPFVKAAITPACAGC